MEARQTSSPVETMPGIMLPEFSSYLTCVLLSDRVCDPASVNNVRNPQRGFWRNRLSHFARNMAVLRASGRRVLGHRSPGRWSLSRGSLGRRGLRLGFGILLRMLGLENLDFQMAQF